MAIRPVCTICLLIFFFWFATFMYISVFLLRSYNNEAYTSPQLFGQFFNFRIFINFFIYEVKKPLKF